MNDSSKICGKVYHPIHPFTWWVMLGLFGLILGMGL